jgi:hypothetical protein
MKNEMRYRHELYAIAVAADAALQRALEARFGKDACEARYRELPPDLQPLAEEFQKATDRYLAAC